MPPEYRNKQDDDANTMHPSRAPGVGYIVIGIINLLAGALILLFGLINIAFSGSNPQNSSISFLMEAAYGLVMVGVPIFMIVGSFILISNYFRNNAQASARMFFLYGVLPWILIFGSILLASVFNL